MTKNMKFIAPLTLVAFATLASCGGTSVKSIRLKRVTYSNVVDNAADITGVIESARRNQAEYFVVHEGEDWMYKRLKKYNLFTNGTQTSNIGFNLSGSLKAYIEDINPIELDGVGIGAVDSFTTSWDLTEGKEYVKFTDSKGGVNYVVNEGGKDTPKYIRYMDTTIEGKKYSADITTYINDVFGGYLENFIMVESASNSGIIIRKGSNNPFIGAAMDMSGFSYKVDFKAGGEPDTATYKNYLSMGDYLTYDLSGLKLPIKGLDGTVAKYIDVIVPLAQRALDVLKISEVSFINNYTKDDNDSACSFELGLNVDLSLIETVLDLITPFYPLPIDYSASGNASLDYFLSFEKNFVRQQELTLDLKDVNLMFNLYNGIVIGRYPIPSMLIDLKNADLEVVMNENVEEGKCKIDTIDKSQYTLIE